MSSSPCAFKRTTAVDDQAIYLEDRSPSPDQGNIRSKPNKNHHAHAFIGLRTLDYLSPILLYPTVPTRLDVPLRSQPRASVLSATFWPTYWFRRRRVRSTRRYTTLTSSAMFLPENTCWHLPSSGRVAIFPKERVAISPPF